MKQLVVISILLLANAAWGLSGAEEPPAPPLSVGVVAMRDYVAPVLVYEVWRDDAFSLFGGRVSADVLVGYDARPSAEQAIAGYQLALNYVVSPTMQAYMSVVYADRLGSVSWRDLGDRLGLGVGVKLRL